MARVISHTVLNLSTEKGRLGKVDIQLEAAHSLHKVVRKKSFRIGKDLQASEAVELLQIYRRVTGNMYR